MRVRLHAAARHVHVPECALIYDSEFLAAFGGDIDVALARERRCADLDSVVSHLHWGILGKRAKLLTQNICCAWIHGTRLSGMVS